MHLQKLMSWILIATTLASAAHAEDQATSDLPEACQFLNDDDFKDSNTELRKKNCKMLFSNNKLIPNKKALNFTLNYMRDNYGKLADPSCLPPAVGGKVVTKAVRGRRGRRVLTYRSSAKDGVQGIDNDRLQGGIKNSCTFVINDLNSKWNGMPLRSNAYVVDLCSTSSSKVVANIYMNKGTGVKKVKNKGRTRLIVTRGFTDKPEAHTTSAGAYLTGDRTFAFQPEKKTAPYRSLERKGLLRGLRIFGVNSSNNTTSLGKPIHTSPYTSSWGCPSIDPKNIEVLSKLANGGPSLVMNYGNDEMHQDTKTCDNESMANSNRSTRPGGGLATASRSRSVTQRSTPPEPSSEGQP